jgi:hypothetical protein
MAQKTRSRASPSCPGFRLRNRIEKEGRIAMNTAEISAMMHTQVGNLLLTKSRLFLYLLLTEPRLF